MKIKHYTCFTDSHKIFLKYFLNTFPFDKDVDLSIRYMEQKSDTGNFITPGWNDTMQEKVKLILDYLQPGTDLFIYSDADIVFFRDYKDAVIEEMGDADIIFQSDVGTPCMGFFACKISDEIRRFFADVHEATPKFRDDQPAAISLLASGKYKLKAKLFSQRFFNYGMFRRTYRGEDGVVLPDNLIMLHANFTENISDKLKLTKIALKQYNLL